MFVRLCIGAWDRWESLLQWGGGAIWRRHPEAGGAVSNISSQLHAHPAGWQRLRACKKPAVSSTALKNPGIRHTQHTTYTHTTHTRYRPYPIRVVFGEPIAPREGEEAEALHARYCAGLLALAKAHDVPLRIVE